MCISKTLSSELQKYFLMLSQEKKKNIAEVLFLINSLVETNLSSKNVKQASNMDPENERMNLAWLQW